MTKDEIEKLKREVSDALLQNQIRGGLLTDVSCTIDYLAQRGVNFGKVAVPDGFQDLAFGLYKIYWKGGGSSLAAVGGTHCGKRWYSPTNWTDKDELRPRVTSTDWSRVDRVEVISAAPTIAEGEG